MPVSEIKHIYPYHLIPSWKATDVIPDILVISAGPPSIDDSEEETLIDEYCPRDVTPISVSSWGDFLLQNWGDMGTTAWNDFV